MFALPVFAAAQDTSAAAPAIVLRAEVTARELRFARRPEVRMRLMHGTLDSVRVLERRNLPEPVQPGVTYRDVYIAVEVIGRLRAECLAERISGRDVGACRAGDEDVRRSP